MIIDGRKIAADIIAELKNLKQDFLGKKIYGILVGNDHASLSFLIQKKRAAEELGLIFIIKKFKRSLKWYYLAMVILFTIGFFGLWLGSTIAAIASGLGLAAVLLLILRLRNKKIVSEQELTERIVAIGARKSVVGIIVQLRIPNYSREETQRVLDAVPYNKDIDCLGVRRSAEFYAHPLEAKIVPPAAGAVKSILAALNVGDLPGKKAVVYGFGRLVGQPAESWLRAAGAEITVLRSASTDEERVRALSGADIIVTGVGKPEEVRISGATIKPGAIVIDFGYPADVDAASIDKAGGIVTPTPGGTGPILVAELFRNLIKLHT